MVGYLSPVVLLQHQHHALKHVFALRSMLRSIPYHLRTLWLFTFSDLKTIVGPCTMFAILQRVGISAFMDGGDEQENSAILPPMNVGRILMVMTWTWITLLAENLANQRKSIEEDRLNKPWRPLPAGRITAHQATCSMWTAYLASVLFGILSGGHFESIALVGLGIWYNDFNGVGSSWFTRNFVNACGITSFLSGALSTMLFDPQDGGSAIPHLQHPLLQSTTIRMWMAVLWLIIMTGIQAQDLSDQIGDAMINRRSMPLVLGDNFTRWTVVSSVLFWSCFCPYFWSLTARGYILPLVLGACVAWRTRMKKELEDDKLTYKIWNLWFVTFFTLPLQVV